MRASTAGHRPAPPERSSEAPPGDPGPALLGAVVALLCVIGLVMVLSASSVQALHDHGGAWTFFVRQLVWVLIGAVGLAVTATVDYRWWRRGAVPLLVVSSCLLVAVLVPGIGISANGSTRWLGAGALRFQPSEMAKLAVLLFTAELLSRRAEYVGDWQMTVRPVVLVAGAVVGLVLVEPDMGTALVIAFVAVALLFVAGTPMRVMVKILAGLAVAALVAGFVASYRRARLLSFLDPWKDPSNTGYQIAQSLVALGTGHLTGVGLGASRAKWGFLPNAHTDFIFAILGEELGLLGAVLVVGLFAALAGLGVRTALRAPDRFGILVAAGITAWLAGQAFVNLGAVVGILPITGVPLPFVSFGGSSLVIAMVGAGILLNIARQGAARASRAQPASVARPRRR